MTTTVNNQNTLSVPRDVPEVDTHTVTTKDAEDGKVPYFQLYKFASLTDKCLILLGGICAIVNGSAMPVFSKITGIAINAFTAYDQSVHMHTRDSARFTNEMMDAARAQFQSSIYYAIGLFLILAAVTLVASFFQMTCFQLSAENQTYVIKNAYFKSLIGQEVAFFDSQKRGELTTRITSDVETINDGIADKVGLAIQHTSTFFVAFIVAFTTDPILSTVLAGCLPFLLAAFAFTGLTNVKFMKDSLAAYGSSGAVAEEVLSNQRTVVSFNNQPLESERYKNELEKVRVHESKKGYIAGVGLGSIFLVLYATFAIGFWFSALRISEGSMSVGALVTCIISFLIGSMSLGSVAPHISYFVTAQAAAFQIFKVIDRKSLVDPFSGQGIESELVKGHIEFKDVNFIYPSRPDVPILKKFSLIAEPGQTVALVGQSGSGKSTCVGLLERFYLPNAGMIALDGVSIDQLNVNWLRGQIGYVGQEPVLFSGTLRENIAYGATPNPVSDQQIWDALKQANAAEFVSDLPDKLDTLIGERGANLSGGQKQRICIARALIRDPKIIFFDEATSALDTQSEAVVQEALNKAAEGRTAFLIAHRLSTVRHADKIVVMKQGVVIEVGTHDSLIEAKGFYYSLVNDQQVASEPEEEFSNAEESLEQERSRPSSILSKMSNTSIVKPKHINDEVEPEPRPFVRAMKMNLSQWKWTVTGVLSAAVAGASTPAYAVLYGRAVGDYGRLLNDPVALRASGSYWGGAFAVIAVISGLANYMQTMGFVVSGEAIVAKLRGMCFSALLEQEGAYYDRVENTVGAMAGKLATEANLIRKLVGDVLGNVVQVITSIAIGCILALVGGWQLALVVIVCVPFLILAGMYQSRAQRGIGNPETDSLAAAMSSEAMGNVRTIASLGLEPVFITNFDKILSKYRPTTKKSIVLGGFAFGISNALIFVVYAIAFTYTASLVLNGVYAFSQIFQVITVVMFTAVTGGRMSGFIPEMAKARHAALDLFRILDRVPEIRDIEMPRLLNQPVKGSVRFDNVHFRYPSRPKVKVHRGLSFKVPAGSKVALVGSSGCGKSTCVQLLERFYDPTSGSISIDDINIMDITLKELRSNVALVGQEPVLFSGTIMDNIKYGAFDPKSAHDDDAIQAAKDADVHSFIMQLPKGYETPVGERGSMLSGGQKQRVAIARALMRKPTILLLDEATSALDAESEVAVQLALEAASRNRTSISIAHRLSTVANSDIIFVFHKGKVVEQGTHKHLIGLKGHYFKLVEAQMESDS